jgi:hypothetical protein
MSKLRSLGLSLLNLSVTGIAFIVLLVTAVLALGGCYGSSGYGKP